MHDVFLGTRGFLKLKENVIRILAQYWRGTSSPGLSNKEV
jgi:hypothetical protein